jgi:RNA polymerase sigma factor (sigma-70 family)
MPDQCRVPVIERSGCLLGVQGSIAQRRLVVVSMAGEVTRGEAIGSMTADGSSLPGFGQDFAALYERRYGEMVRLAGFVTGLPDAAPDLVHDAFIKVHEAWPRVLEPDAYLRRTVVNLSRSHVRRLVRYRAVAARQDRERPPSGDAGSPDLILDALGALPKRQASALVLRFYLGLPDDEIAAILRCRVGTVASLIHRGLHSLRKVIEP